MVCGLCKALDWIHGYKARLCAGLGFKTTKVQYFKNKEYIEYVCASINQEIQGGESKQSNLSWEKECNRERISDDS